MAFTAGQQLLGSFVCGRDSQNVHEIPSCMTRNDKLTCLMAREPSVQKRSMKSISQSSSSPSLLSALPPTVSSELTSTSSNLAKEKVVTIELPTYRKCHAVLEREREMALSMHSWSEVEWLLTELRRSLLETQWALTTDSSCDTEVVKENVLVKSGKPSARDRRLQCRDKTKRRPVRTGKKSSMEISLTSVSTLGLKGRRELLTKEEEVILSKKIKVGHNLKAVRAKLKKTIGYQPSDELWASSVNLTLQQVQSKIWESDRARDQMFVSNLRLVFSVANKYTGHGVNLSDLIQEGAIGLLRGLEKFDHNKGFKLSTYVHWWIRQGITRALADHSRTVRLPAHMHERLNAINKAAASLRSEGVSVSLKTLSQAVNMPDEMVNNALKSTKKMVSLDKPKRWGQFGAEEDTLHNYIADIRPESDPWIAIDRMSMKDDVDFLLKKILNKREREIVRLHYGLDNADGIGMSLEKISHRYGISRERTRQVEGCALRKLAASGLSMNLNTPLSIQ